MLTPNEFQELSKRTAQHADLAHWMLGIVGEAWEINNAPILKLEDEVGDLLWYCANYATALDLKLSDVLGVDRFGVNFVVEGLHFESLSMYLVLQAAHLAEDTKKFLYPTRQTIKIDILRAGLLRVLLAIESCVSSLAPHLQCPITLESAAVANVKKLSKRFPQI